MQCPSEARLESGMRLSLQPIIHSHSESLMNGGIGCPRPVSPSLPPLLIRSLLALQDPSMVDLHRARARLCHVHLLAGCRWNQ